jgi:DNA repair protein RecN (Recombination protein N)
MLKKLVIRNYAIIDHLVYEPDARLNTITGETGAGKSIILGALSLILGERADSSVLKDGNKAVVEAHFAVAGNVALAEALAEAELDNDDICLVRREVAPNGKSRAFVNDTPVTLNVLHTVASKLVDLHLQFGHLALEDDRFALDVADALADNQELRTTYSALYSRHKKLLRQIADLKEKRALWQKEADYKQYLLDELVQAGFKPGEIEAAEQKIKTINHAERIKTVLQGCRVALEEGEQPILNGIKLIIKQLNGIGEVLPEVKGLQERLNASWAELKDIAEELENHDERTAYDPEKADALQQRIDLGYKLFKKHSVTDTAGLQQVRDNLDNELQTTLNLNDTIEHLAGEEAVVYKELLAVAAQLSQRRKEEAPKLTEKLNALLPLVGMPNAKMKVQVATIEPSNNGIDEVSFLLDANKSGQFQLLQKAASGGEASRIMLCIKSLTANALQMPTLIFDEVDTGISGEAARQVGALLRKLADYHQVICITHQPQVAARGTSHAYVYKEAEASGRLSTKMRILPAKERILAIARMIGGDNPGDAAISSAKELLQ